DARPAAWRCRGTSTVISGSKVSGLRAGLGACWAWAVGPSDQTAVINPANPSGPKIFRTRISIPIAGADHASACAV
ncbi:hypothetical protein, partial [Bradyrhizobium sp. STM 3809]|uniref:hypothetical protein n=1 Tax=Bradyrhizobium sp. STM 3809 TaxID=551936 RepID=UPI001AEBCB85